MVVFSPKMWGAMLLCGLELSQTPSGIVEMDFFVSFIDNLPNDMLLLSACAENSAFILGNFITQLDSATFETAPSMSANLKFVENSIK